MRNNLGSIVNEAPPLSRSNSKKRRQFCNLEVNTRQSVMCIGSEIGFLSFAQDIFGETFRCSLLVGYSFFLFFLAMNGTFYPVVAVKWPVSSHVEILDSLIVFIYYRKVTQRSSLFVLLIVFNLRRD